MLSETTLLIVINSIILPIVAIVLKINRDQSGRIEKLEAKLDDCLMRNSQSGTWQAGQERQRDMLKEAPLKTGDTKPLT